MLRLWQRKEAARISDQNELIHRMSACPNLGLLAPALMYEAQRQQPVDVEWTVDSGPESIPASPSPFFFVFLFFSFSLLFSSFFPYFSSFFASILCLIRVEMSGRQCQINGEHTIVFETRRTDDRSFLPQDFGEMLSYCHLPILTDV